MEHVNLYQSLGVGREDCAIAVRRAYRDLARLSSPATDSVPVFMQEIDLACAVLSDGARRAHYDRRISGGAAGAAAAGGGASARSVTEEVATVDLLADFEGGPPSAEEVRHAFRCNFAPGAEPKTGRIECLHLLIRIASPLPSGDLAVWLAVPVFHACAGCHGTGSVGWCACGACEGTGLAEKRSAVRLAAARGESVVSLEQLGVRSPILRLQVTTMA
jgi:DnaJ-class molecular chaperone